MTKPIDKDYFLKYVDSGIDYRKSWFNHTSVYDCITLMKAFGGKFPRNICVLGAATGEVLKAFSAHLKVRPFGCEINMWAYNRINKLYRKRIKNQCMTKYLKTIVENGQGFDLVFSNSLIYLDEEQIDVVLSYLRESAAFVHFHSSFEEDACKVDEYRVMLKPEEWWEEKFDKAGFKMVYLESWKGKTYLWQNKRLSGHSEG